MIYTSKLLFCLLCAALLSLPNINQATTTQPTSDNIIHNDTALSVLFDKMYQLASSQQQPIEKLLKVPIVHIGDSHLQTGVLTAVLRERLQMQFGNAGRGLVFPYQVAKTNEPVTFVSSSNVIWEAKRCVFPDRPMPIGLSGITLKTTDPNATLSIGIRSPNKLDYSFDHITLFTDNTEQSFDWQTNNEMLNYPDGSFKRVMYLNQPTNNLQLYCRKNKPEQQYAHLYGISLEKAQSGILYHTIAVNGTQYQHLDAAAYFTKQLPDLEPLLIILSLGTNEAVSRDYNSPSFRYQIDQLVQKLKQSCPGSAIMLTTPANSLKNRQPNPQMLLVADVLRQYAAEKQLPYWDLNTIGGSATDWQNQKMLQTDGIHFTHQGYLFQGDLLHQALLKSYTHYVSGRYK
jgi:lysophospholipase L1-like esterase